MVMYEFELQESSVNTSQPTRSVTTSDIESVSQIDTQTDENCIPPQSKRSTTDQSDVNIDACSSAPIATKYGDTFGLAHRLKKV